MLVVVVVLGVIVALAYQKQADSVRANVQTSSRWARISARSVTAQLERTAITVDLAKRACRHRRATQ